MTKPIVSKKTTLRQDLETTLEEKFSLVRVETNFERLPIWSPKPKRGTIFAPSKTIILEPEVLPNGQIVERRIEIVPTTKYGYLTVVTQEYWYALQKIWHESPEKETGRIEFSITQLLKLLGKPEGKNQRNTAKLSIAQIATNQLEFYYTFYDKEKRETLKEVRSFHLLTGYSLAERKTTQSNHDKCSVTLHPLVVSNLRSGYFKPVLLSVISQLKSDIARILYRKLDLQFSNYSKYEISTERFFKENGIQGKKYKTPSGRKQTIEKAIQELIGKPTSSGAIIFSYKIIPTADGSDLKLIVWAKHGKAKQISSSVSEPTNVIQISETVEKPVHTQKPQKTNPEVGELLEYFDAIFHGKPTSHTRTIKKKATEIITVHGLPFGRFFVKFAHGEATKTKYKPATFNGIVKYLDGAVEEFQKEKRIKQIQTAQVETLKQEQKQSNHQKTYEPVYFEYILSLLEMYSLRLPKEVTEFYKAEAVEEEKLKEAVKNSSKHSLFAKKKMLEIFYRKEQQALRFVAFFEENDAISVPTFWQWDKEINPDSLK